jgi:hypothetical protein
MSEQSQIWFDFIIDGDLWVLIVVKQMNFSIRGLGSNDFLILRHISSFVNFALMIYLDVDRNSQLFVLGKAAPANSICVVIKCIFFIISSVF